MRFRSLLALALSILLIVFFVVNRDLFGATAKVSLLVTRVDAPIGIVMLVLFALLILMLSSILGVWQGTLLAEFRRQAKELEVQRTLAENAEASRFTELGALMRDEMAKSNQRLDAALETLRDQMHASENSLAATLGEMDDRYGRTAAPPRIP